MSKRSVLKRSPQVSGITFAFDPKKPAGSRVDPEFVKVTFELNLLKLKR